jgi:hypothetical protein
MKRTISSLLVVLLLLNVMGFYGVFVGLKYSNTRELIQKFDDDQFSDLDAVTIKVPITVPYYANTDTEFERVDGEVEYKGEFYRLVKQRYANDTLFIVCIKDTNSRNIKQALSDYVKTFTDRPAQSSQSKTIPGFIKDYLITETHLGQVSAGWSYGLTTSSVAAFFSSAFLSVASPPPKA